MRVAKKSKVRVAANKDLYDFVFEKVQSATHYDRAIIADYVFT